MYSPVRTNRDGFLPQSYDVAHDLCFVIHDVLTQLLKSGEESSIFQISIPFRDEADRDDFEQSEDIFGWLEKTRRIDERAALLTTTVFPAVLSDMLHCIYEALESSRKGKLNITYMLLRKPLQESLYLLESVVVDPVDFAQKLAGDPLQLRQHNAGGQEGHKRRIQKVLDIINEAHRFNAEYIAKLRYDKTSEDSFDRACNHAMHLFTEHKAIRTDPLNINFIFSGWEAKLTQWAYLYSRFPYLLMYTYRVIEHVAERIAPTQPEYLTDINRRLSAFVVLWWGSIDEQYVAEPIKLLADQTHAWLLEHIHQLGHRPPTKSDLYRMAHSGALPET